MVEQVKVEQPRNKNRRSEADLPKHLKAEKPKSEPRAADKNDPGNPANRPHDFQLSYALDLLRGMTLLQQRKDG